MTRVLTDDLHTTVAADHLAFLTDLLDAWTYFQILFAFFRRDPRIRFTEACSPRWVRPVLVERSLVVFLVFLVFLALRMDHL
jgi:hypothetical protein